MNREAVMDITAEDFQNYSNYICVTKDEHNQKSKDCESQ